MKTTRRKILKGAAILASAGMMAADVNAGIPAAATNGEAAAQGTSAMQGQARASATATSGSARTGEVPGAPDYSAVGLDSIAGVQADSGPYRTESGVGALMAWADKLWAVTYISDPGRREGSGTGLYVIDEKLNIEKLHVSNGT